MSRRQGAGQWGGLAVAIASALIGINAKVFMTKNSYMNKKQRVLFMRVFGGADVSPSPSDLTEFGKKTLAKDPNHPPGSLGGVAISEAIEYAVGGEGRKYIPGSVLEFVLLHQTVIGQEAMQQMPEEPDLVVGCVGGGGSNFSGLSFPFIGGAKLMGKGGFERTRFLAVESNAAPQADPRLVHV